MREHLRGNTGERERPGGSVPMRITPAPGELNKHQRHMCISHPVSGYTHNSRRQVS